MDASIALNHRSQRAMDVMLPQQKHVAACNAWGHCLQSKCDVSSPLQHAKCRDFPGMKAAVCLTEASGNITLQLVAVPIEALRKTTNQNEYATDGLRVSGMMVISFDTFCLHIISQTLLNFRSISTCVFVA